MKKMSRREDYLKLIYTLSRRGEVRGADLADELDIKRPTVCVYLKRLAANGDITMDEHHCVFLTVQGLAVAEATLDKHDMLSDLLQDLGGSQKNCNGRCLRHRTQYQSRNLLGS